MTRGDTFLATISITQGDEPYTPAAGDVITFALKHVKKNAAGTEYTDGEPLITKEIPHSTMVLQLDPEDTKGLGFGTYAYDVQIKMEDGTVDTFIADARLILRPEVG